MRRGAEGNPIRGTSYPSFEGATPSIRPTHSCGSLPSQLDRMETRRVRGQEQNIGIIRGNR